jgi:UDP:flavonoid glycosyltransferase YjiC (YdhE family)
MLTLCSTGIPQMVLPMWADLYENAVRAEFLGIGVWGNKKAAPNWAAEELGEAFLRVLGDGEEAVKIRKKAHDLGRVFQKDPGRVRAAREIAKLAQLA